jgi:NADPH2:quinone reductase
VLAAAGFKLGDRVCALVAGGGYAEYCVARLPSACPCLTGLSDVEAASLPETVFTVWSNLMDRARLQAGETVDSGWLKWHWVSLPFNWPKPSAPSVFVTAGSDEKCEACLALVRDEAINYKSAGFSG